ncbi:MAG: pyruvate dehydrogenase (acetyl-transferring) E1 component subunit alpha [Gammaproteobacteria bacterium]|nr:pyruvate dehydrogenase (acetyl-transferring) E1 component subunit alpha [Gammaproteobacteria bacterium]
MAQFQIPFYQFIDEQSISLPDAPKMIHDEAHLLKLYRAMLLNRLFDHKAIALQRTGRMGTYPSTRGQEAVFVGIGDALARDDIFVPYYRDVATLIMRGVPAMDILLYWGGDERGNAFADPKHNLPYNVPISSQLLHAAGIATATKIRQQKNAVLVTCGDGATSQGDFYETLNVAGIWSLPLVVVINNNQWAISVPRTAQTAACTLAQKAIAAGIDGEQVDGNDVVAVRERVAVALEKARTEQKPTLLEMICYRQSDHTTADDASRYEAAGARDTEWQKEPIQRLRRYLEAQHHFTEAQETSLQESCTQDIEKIMTEYQAVTPEKPTAMFDSLYETLPDIYSAQRAMLEDI